VSVTSSSERPRILVVEDDHATAVVIRDLLESEGYNVGTAPDGATGLAHVEADGVDLVLLDLMLPDLNGFELCRHVRAHETGVYLPIIMLTAMTAERDRHAGFAAGADDYVTKPFEVHDLLDRVHVWLRTRQRLKQQQEALARQASLLDLASDAIFVHTLEHRITYWSAGAETLFGWSRAEAQDRIAPELLRTEYPAPLSEIDAMLLRDGTWTGELVHTRRDGSQVHVASRWALQTDNEGRPVAVLQLNTDVTVWETMREAEQMRLAARLESLSRAAREIAHLLNDDLAVALGTTQLLQLDLQPALPEQLRELVGEAARGLDSAVQHIEQLNRLARGHLPPGGQS
jgi:PAS domain S-box-containing protein